MSDLSKAYLKWIADDYVWIQLFLLFALGYFSHKLYMWFKDRDK
jgi:hypothetical protein